jgi:MinD superfamily P-loop ATPase
MKKVVVGSGKGGVGKSMLAASLAILSSQENKLVGVDCDVDAPNMNIWLGGGRWKEKKPISVTEKPVIDQAKCNGCGKCEENCRFSAIKVKDGKAVVNPFLCEGCGVCQIVCPQKAIKMEPAENGFINYRQTKYKFKLISGSLSPGESGSGKIVTEVKKEAEKEEAELMIIDSSPGTGCPVIASLQGTDFAVLITEPTPAGQADLNRILELVLNFQIPYGVVINKADINPQVATEIEDKFKGKILGKINYDQKIFQSLIKLKPILETSLKAKEEIEDIYRHLKDRLKDGVI